MAENTQEKTEKRLVEDLEKTEKAYDKILKQKKEIADLSEEDLRKASQYQDSLNKINAIGEKQVEQR